MLENILILIYKPRLLNKLSDWNEFYTVEMKSSGERVIHDINRVKQLQSVQMCIGADVESHYINIAIPNWLRAPFESIITTLDALGEESDFLTLITV